MVNRGSGFPPRAYKLLGLFSVFLLVWQLLTTTPVVLFGRDAEATIVEVKRRGRYTEVIAEHRTQDGEELRSSGFADFNAIELYDFAVALGRIEEGEPIETARARLIGAKVKVRYVPARPALGAIKAWVTLYRSFVAQTCFWIACAGMAAFAYRFRRPEARR